MDSHAVDPAPPRVPPPLDALPVTAGNHFRVHFFAAAGALLDFVESLEAPGLLERHPFLRAYGAETGRVGPNGWWPRGVVGWEERHSGRLPLRQVTRALDLPPPARLPLLLAGLVEADLRFGTLFAELQAPLSRRRPTLELVGRILAAVEGGGDPARWLRPFLEAGYLEALDPGAPRAERAVRVPDPVWAALRGEATIPADGVVHHGPEAFPPAAELALPASVLRRVSRAVPLLEAGRTRVVVVEGAAGEDRLALLGSLAAAVGRGVVTLRSGDVGSAAPGASPPSFLGPLATLLDAIPVFRFDMGPGETADVPELRGYAGAVGVMRGREGGLRGPGMDRALVLAVPPLRAPERRRAWQSALGPAAGPDLERLVERYHLPGGHIRRLAEMARAEAALAGRTRVSLADVQEARRSLGREALDTLAERLEPGVPPGDAWSMLVAGAVVGDRLLELERRCRHRERLLEHLGPAFGSETGRGVRALFAGPSGTGKTLAARLLAARLGMDLYRVDLAAVVNKYIGETEKNLHRVLTTAEELDVLLLLDEGDALLGSRTEVKSANDRYANLETNYLLQRLEHYDGVVVVTTNLGENVDPAFQRRMDLVVDFLPPRPEERRRLWDLHLPARHRVDEAFLEAVSGQCVLTGGQIRNAAQLATLLALDGGEGDVARPHLEAALRSEYRKAGATYALEHRPSPGRRTAATRAFLGDLPR
jgi:hypothetical protein